MKRKPFRQMTREEQRMDLIRRYRKLRSEIEQQLRDENYFNEVVCPSKGWEPLGLDQKGHIAELARIDQQIVTLEAQRP